MLNNAEMKKLERLATKPVKIDVAGLKPSNFEGNWKILNKYFRDNNRELDRFHFPVMSAEEYEAVAETIGAKGSNLKFETASEYYKRKARVHVAAIDLGVPPKLLDTSSYFWDERMYLFTDFWYNVHYVEELYRENDDRCKNTWESYACCDVQTKSVDTELVNELYHFCVKAIQKRKACLIGKVDTCLGMLIAIRNGATNITVQQAATLQGYKSHFHKMCTDKEVTEFTSKYSDFDVLEPGDYLETYRKLFQLLNGTGELERDYLKAILHNDNDKLEDYIFDAAGFEYDRVASLKLGL